MVWLAELDLTELSLHVFLNLFDEMTLNLSYYREGLCVCIWISVIR